MSHTTGHDSPVFSCIELPREKEIMSPKDRIHLPHVDHLSVLFRNTHIMSIYVSTCAQNNLHLSRCYRELLSNITYQELVRLEVVKCSIHVLSPIFLFDHPPEQAVVSQNWRTYEFMCIACDHCSKDTHIATTCVCGISRSKHLQYRRSP